eukprot:TRINITY_DN1667_c0_g1_i2.p1 TRINITY_DN1667_c0_g1~~TRINITY_DN1667_c0_g1_i2.p1  ORF type:complete len:483 (+),score=100.60 TRINITY_DN1667_c0_g1_i2:107-1450(+)
MKTSLALLLTATAGAEGAAALPSWTAELNAARQYSWSKRESGAVLAWADEWRGEDDGSTSCLDRTVKGAHITQSTEGVVSVANVEGYLVRTVDERTGMCNGLDTDGIQHVSIAEVGGTAVNVITYNAPEDSTTTPVTTVEAPHQVMTGTTEPWTSKRELIAEKRRRNLMRAETTSVGTGYVTCWNKERGSLGNLKIFCRMFNNDGTPVDKDRSIYVLPVTSGDDATSISIINMESDGTTLSLQSFAIAITHFPAALTEAPRLYLGIYSFDSTTTKFVVERTIQEITFDPTFGPPLRFGRQAIQIAKAHGSNPTSLVIAYGTATHAVSQLVHSTNNGMALDPLALADAFSFPVGVFGRTVLSTPSVFYTGSSLLFSFLEGTATTTYVRTLHIGLSNIPTLLADVEVGGLTFVGQTHIGTVGTGYFFSVINEVVPGQPRLEVHTFDLLP